MRDMKAMALEAGFTADEFAWHDHMFERFEALVRADEREACAVIAFNADTYIQAAAAIRARGNT